jgi:hypothetical protein
VYLDFALSVFCMSENVAAALILVSALLVLWLICGLSDIDEDTYVQRFE